MAQDRMIQINRAPGETLAAFDPSPKLVNFNDTITWRNNDPTEAHWPAPVAPAGGQFDPSGWMPAQILAGGTSFQALTFGTAQQNPPDQTYQYVCANHQNEKGTIIVTSKAVPPEPAEDDTEIDI
jgi:plastocyanin